MIRNLGVDALGDYRKTFVGTLLLSLLISLPLSTSATAGDSAHTPQTATAHALSAASFASDATLSPRSYGSSRQAM